MNGAPVFAVEVRSGNDFGPRHAWKAKSRKRADYFAAGTLVVWDVNPFGEDEIVFKYSASAPQNPQVSRRGEVAAAGNEFAAHLFRPTLGECVLWPA